MSTIFPFTKQKDKRYGTFGFLFTLALFGLAVYLTFWVKFLLSFVVSWCAMVVNCYASGRDVLDSAREVRMKRLNALIGLVGCTITFYYNVLIRDGKIFLITRPFEEVGLGDTIILSASALFYLICLCCALSAWRSNNHYIRDEKRSAVKMEGADGKQYLMPGSAETAWEVYTESEFTKDTKIARDVLSQHLADIMYEEFQRGEYELRKNPFSNVDNEIWGYGKSYDPRNVWADYAYSFHAETAKHMESRGLYDKAREYMDRCTEILLKRSSYVNRHDVMKSKELREKVYSHFPDSARNPAVEKAYAQVLNNAYEEQAKVDQRMREYEAGAAERRLEREARYYEEEDRERKKKQLQAEYEAKLKKVDDWSNALASAEDGTVYNDWHDSRIPGDGVDADAYRRREFLRDEKKDQYRKEYEEALRELDDDE